MTVIYKDTERMFKAHEMIWANKELVDAIVKSMLISQTEAFIDMMVDCQRDEPVTRESANETLKGVQASAMDFWNDIVGDLELAVQERLKTVLYGAAVTGLKFNLAGEVTDIEVDVSVTNPV